MTGKFSFDKVLIKEILETASNCLVGSLADEEIYFQDSQFVNASEYGFDNVIKPNEVGQYRGKRVIICNGKNSKLDNEEKIDYLLKLTNCSDLDRHIKIISRKYKLTKSEKENIRLNILGRLI